MATLEDKILGEKLHCYCSSSESDGEKSDDEKDEAGASSKDSQAALPDPAKWEGTSTNTGPKGVIKDWQRFKQLETERRKEQDRERVALMKKLAITCKSAGDEEKEAAAAQAASEDPELQELLSDAFLQQYQEKRMQEMMNQYQALPTFGEVIVLNNSQEFLDAIDKENKNVTVIIHIYKDDVPACEAMNGCLACLCTEFPKVKFCRINGSDAGMSKPFMVRGVPALLVYKGGQLIGNFIRLSNDLGNDFFADDVGDFLIEHGILPDKTCVPKLIRDAALRAGDE